VPENLSRAARRLGLSRRTAKAYWYGERTDVPAELMDRARNIANEPLVIEAKNELTELRERIARLEAILMASTNQGGGVAGRDFP
jgi:hypothetical protein